MIIRPKHITQATNIGIGHSGFSLLEVLIGLLITTSVMASVSQVYQLLMKRYHPGLNEQYLLHRLTQLADSIVTAVDSHPLPDLLKTHEMGKVLHTDGTEIVLNQPMAPNSNAITFGRLNFRDLVLNRKAASGGGNTAMIEGCGVSLFLEEITDIKRFLSFSGDGYLESLGGFNKVSNNCVAGAIYPSRGLIASLSLGSLNPDNIALFVAPLFIVPITELLTFYLDEAGTVRLLNHQGDRIIENQPLFNGALELSFKIHNLKAGLLPAIEVWVKTAQKREFTIFREARLVRSNPISPYQQLAGIFKQQM